jgi:ornithine cyclodeaminase/alanine dehydrogenase-like protein (mu-crystallin family)
MRIFDAKAVEASLAYPELVDVLAGAFMAGAVAPPRHHHTVKLNGRPDATLLLMPAWEARSPGIDIAGRHLGIKTVTVFPDNAQHGLPAVLGTYLLLSAETGETLAIMDATRLTVWRTAAASALASRYLSREDTSRMLMVGAGQLAPYLIRAHMAVRPIREIEIWNHRPAGAERLAASLRNTGLRVSAVTDLEYAVRKADLISTATLSAKPLIEGAWLQTGTHLDCVGAFKKTMRETDDEVVRRARIFVDTLGGALSEAGDIIQPLEAGIINQNAVLADLYDLTQGRVKGRSSAQEITLFKSTGASIEDLAAAIFIYQRS